MAKKNARHKRRICENKVAYETVDQARKGIVHIYQNSFFKRKMNVYKCRYCGKYHIGHRPNKYNWR